MEGTKVGMSTRERERERVRENKRRLWNKVTKRKKVKGQKYYFNDIWKDKRKLFCSVFV
jgi:hypothetical protein